MLLSTRTYSVIVSFFVALLPGACFGSVLDFETFTGSSLFGAPPQTLNIPTSIGNVKITGGVVLTRETNLPADQTSVYGSAAFGDLGYSNPITIAFPERITNFFLDVYNGNTEDVTYTVADNDGHSSTFSLPDNFSSGQSLVGFAATGDVVTITAAPSSGDLKWDFSIDNVAFNEPLPSSLAPEPRLTSIVGIGLAGILFGAIRRRKARNTPHFNT